MNRELVHELLDAVLDVQEAGDYASLDVSNHGSMIMAYHIRGGFKIGKRFNYSSSRNTSDTEELQEIISYFKDVKKALTPASN